MVTLNPQTPGDPACPGTFQQVPVDSALTFMGNHLTSYTVSVELKAKQSSLFSHSHSTCGSQHHKAPPTYLVSSPQDPVQEVPNHSLCVRCRNRDSESSAVLRIQAALWEQSSEH